MSPRSDLQTFIRDADVRLDQAKLDAEYISRFANELIEHVPEDGVHLVRAVQLMADGAAKSLDEAQRSLCAARDAVEACGGSMTRDRRAHGQSA